MADEPIQKGKNMADHFVETIEMVAIGSGALGRQIPQFGIKEKG